MEKLGSGVQDGKMIFFESKYRVCKYCGEKVEIINSVGSLFIELKDGRVYMSGPAETVYTGQYIYGGNK